MFAAPIRLESGFNVSWPQPAVPSSRQSSPEALSASRIASKYRAGSRKRRSLVKLRKVTSQSQLLVQPQPQAEGPPLVLMLIQPQAEGPSQLR